MKILSRIHIDSEKIILNDQPVEAEGTGAELLKNVYRKYINDYPKFFKMDALCRLGFVASELLLQNEDRSDFRSDRAIILFNQHSSEAADKAYQATIGDKDNYFPSPAAFVYTLPNIVTGEIAIRNHYQGETCFYVLDHRDDDTIKNVIEETFMDEETSSALAGWLDAVDLDHFEADLFLVEK